MASYPDLDKVERLLTAWAKWVCADGHKLGYPTEAAFAYKTPPDFAEGTDELLKIDRAIAGLHKKLRRAIKYEYLFVGWPTNEKAMVLGVSRQTLWRWLREARYQLAEKLDMCATDPYKSR